MKYEDVARDWINAWKLTNCTMSKQIPLQLVGKRLKQRFPRGGCQKTNEDLKLSYSISSSMQIDDRRDFVGLW
jgi:hypothetical protein